MMVATLFLLANLFQGEYEQQATEMTRQLAEIEAARADLAGGHASIFRGVAWLNARVDPEVVGASVADGVKLIDRAIRRVDEGATGGDAIIAAMAGYRQSIDRVQEAIAVEPFLAAMFLSNADIQFDEANRRIRELSQAITERAARLRENAADTRDVFLGLCLLGAVALVAAVFASARFIGRAIATPLADIVTTTVAFADGHLDRPIPCLDRQDEVGSIASALEVFRDTARQLNEQAYFDRLTGLANRANFHRALEHLLAATIARGTRGALLLIDLDRFKEINDTLGHDAGDEVLRIAGKALMRVVREGDLVARLGGDEFALLLAEVSGPDAAGALASRLIAALQETMQVCGEEVHVGASVGIAMIPDHGTRPEDLLKHADISMYRAKSQRSGTFSFFDPSLTTAIMRRKAIETELRRAIAEEALVLAFQPKYRLDDGSLSSLEALCRWNGSTGSIAPAEFIPIAEASGLIHDLGLWVIRESCRQYRQWTLARFPVPGVSVNVSALQLRRPGFADDVERIVEDFGIQPRHLMIELTESVFADPDNQPLLDNINRLGALGFELSLDDFGTGFSSMGCLRHLPFRELKIDRSFVEGLGVCESATGIVKGIVDLGHALGMRITAEGLENVQQLAVLRSLECDIGQGYLLGKPASAEEVRETWLSSPVIDAFGGGSGTQKRARCA